MINIYQNIDQFFRILRNPQLNQVHVFNEINLISILDHMKTFFYTIETMEIYGETIMSNNSETGQNLLISNLIPPPVQFTAQTQYFSSAAEISNDLFQVWKCWRKSNRLDALLSLFEKQIKDELSFTWQIQPESKDTYEWEWLLFCQDDLKKNQEHLQFKLKEIQSFYSTLGDDRKLFETEGYLLSFAMDRILIIAPSQHGCFNALQTLRQILRFINLNEPIEQREAYNIIDYPKIEKRAFHLDLKGLMHTFEYIKKFIGILAEYKYNCITIEYEDKFPYKGFLEAIPHKYAWTMTQFHEILDLCANNFIEVIPLIQVFGHVECYIRKPEYQHLQETPTGKPMVLPIFHAWSLCPLNPDSEHFAFEMIDQIVQNHPQSEYVHIGADEVYQLGTCPKCQEYVKKNSKSALYIEYINKIAERVLAKGKTPIMWHDYLLKYPENLNKLNKKIVIMYWIYDSWREDPNPKILPHFEFFQKMGFRVMGAPSISSDFLIYLPNYQRRLENIMGQTYRIRESKSLGCLITSWACCASPLETQILAAICGASFMWAPLSDLKEIPWNYLDHAIQTHVFDIPVHLQKPWFENFVKATEIRRHNFPTTDAIKRIPIALKELEIMQKIRGKNPAILRGSEIGLKYRKYYADILEKMQQLMIICQKYDESDGNNGDFPTQKHLEKFSKSLENLIENYEIIAHQVNHLYIEETKQIYPGEWDFFWRLDRYKIPEWINPWFATIKELQGHLETFLMTLFRVGMDLKLD